MVALLRTILPLGKCHQTLSACHIPAHASAIRLSHAISNTGGTYKSGESHHVPKMVKLAPKSIANQQNMTETNRAPALRHREDAHSCAVWQCHHWWQLANASHSHGSWEDCSLDAPLNLNCNLGNKSARANGFRLVGKGINHPKW